MAYNSDLAERIRAKMAGVPSIEERDEGDVLTFFLNGRMVCGVYENELVVWVDPEKYHDIEVNVPFARPYAIEGTPVGSWMAIAPEGLRNDEDVDRWIRESVDAASSLSDKDR